MSIAVLQPKYIFGIKSDVVGNVNFLDETSIIFPAGSNCVLYNIDQRMQRFIPCSEKSNGVTAMAISPNRKYGAVAEKGDRATIVIYDLHSLRKKKILSAQPDMQSGEFVHLAFSPDSKYLVAQGGRPDWFMMYWSWEKPKVMCKMSTTNANNNPVKQVLFNPEDNTLISVIGEQIIKLMRYTEGVLKQLPFAKVESGIYTAQNWASAERLIVGSDIGKILIFDNSELKFDFNVTGAPGTDISLQSRTASATEQSFFSNRSFISGIVCYSKGIAVSTQGGFVHLLDKSDDGAYKNSKIIKIPEEETGDSRKQLTHEIKQLVISPSDEILLASTETAQLYTISMSNIDMSKPHDLAYFELLSQSYHHAAITSLDTCYRKPYIVTTSLDRSVRIWNYETNGLEIWKTFAEEAHSAAIHPSGLYILVGFSDKLRLLNILIDDIRCFKEFNIRGCNECAFSNGGHLFAAVQNSVIQIYSAVNYENVYNLKGHNGKVRSIKWSLDDTKLTSCGTDGAVYEWEIVTTKRVNEIIVKTCAYSGVSRSPDGKNTFAVGNDKTIKEIADSQILREVDMMGSEQLQVVLSNSGRMLFTGSVSGSIRSVKFPLTVPAECEDGTLMIWKVSDKEGRTLKRDRSLPFAEEILITKTDLEEKNTAMQEYKTRVEELKMENEYQLRLKDMNYNEKIKELTERFMQEMESLKTKNQVLKTEKDKMETKHEEEFAEIMEKQAKELQDQEAANSQKLMLEYEKYQEQQTKSQRMQEENDRMVQDMQDSHNLALKEQTEHYELKLQDKEATITQLQMEAKDQLREYEETKKQIEEDADREILDIKNKYEKRLREGREEILRLNGENGIMKKKYESQNKEINNLKSEITRLNSEIVKLNSVIQSLNKDITGLKKEIQERDDTIQEKEKRIYDLKKKNQELEKFKFVLDYKIKELKKQIEPRENDIKEMKEQIQQMETELERFSKSNQQLELNINEMKSKLKATEKEMMNERKRVRDKEALIRHFQTDLHNCVGFIQEPKQLKDSIRSIYQKYSAGDTKEAASVDADIQKEYSRQREHLERSVASLRKKLSKDTEIHRADNVRIMQENVTLIKEINDLRRELKISRSKIHDFEAQLGILNKKKTGNLPDVAAQAKLAAERPSYSAGTLRPDDDPERLIDMQREEIRRMRAQLHEFEMQLAMRPNSGSRLPPMSIEASAEEN